MTGISQCTKNLFCFDPQHSFAEHSEQQAIIAQDLVGKVKQLQDNFTGTPTEEPCSEEHLQVSDTMMEVQQLATQLLSLVSVGCDLYKLTVSLTQRCGVIGKRARTAHS